MISFFPDPYPDELLYSVCARFADRVQFKGNSSVIRELFGSRNNVAIVDLPNHLEYLVTVLPTGHLYTEDQLIDKHTLLPFYSPFCPPERIALVRQNMKCGNSSQNHERLGILIRRIPQWLQFCPLCVESDIEQFGEPYWHRLHQVPGVQVCPVHNVFLEQSTASVRKERQSWEFISANKVIVATKPRSLMLTEPFHQILVNIARDVASLLSQPNLSSSPNAVRNRYLYLLAKRGLATYRGHIYAKALISAFQNFYPTQILDSLGCSLDSNSYQNWLFYIIRSPLKKAQNTLHHLLLIHFLGYTAPDFFQLPTEFHLFGESPWPCLNRASDHFQQLTIKECHIKYYNGRKPVGTFACPCGFVYTRKGPDESASDKYKIGHLISYGDVWSERLKELWLDSTVSILEIARQLGVTYRTVKFHARANGLPLTRSESNLMLYLESRQLNADNNNKKIKLPTTLDTHRQKWLEARHLYPEASRTVLQDKFPVSYRWLKENDCEWFNAHLPDPLRVSKQNVRQQVDWSSRDKELAQAVRKAALDFKNAPGRPIWLTKTAITKKIGIRKLVSGNKAKLPLTIKVLDEVVETQEEYAMRRLKWATELFQQEGVCPPRWLLLLRASLKPKTVAQPQVQSAIECALTTLERFKT